MPFVHIVELIAAIIATRNFKKYRYSNERYFLFFLWFTVLIDGTNAIMNSVFNIEISWLHEVFTVTSFLFYFYWYYTIFRNGFFKKTALFFATIFGCLTIAAKVFPNEMAGKGYAFISGAIGILVMTFFHFYQLLKSNEVLIIKHKLSFWISTGLLLFYIGIIPLILLASYLDIGGSNYKTILLSLNVVLYGCYIIGFLWTKKEYNRF